MSALAEEREDTFWNAVKAGIAIIAVSVVVLWASMEGRVANSTHDRMVRWLYIVHEDNFIVREVRLEPNMRLVAGNACDVLLPDDIICWEKGPGSVEKELYVLRPGQTVLIREERISNALGRRLLQGK